MQASTKAAIKKGLNHVLAYRGLEIVPQRLELSPLRQLLVALHHFEVGCIIDVGANAGQYAEELFKAGYGGEIHSVEPLPDAHQALRKKAQAYPRWHVLPPFAAGATKARVKMQIAGNSLSSSVLPMLKRHMDAAPNSAPIGEIEVSQSPLDGALEDDFWARHRSTLLKVDTQGYEHNVLEGANNCLAHIKLVQLELSLQPLYEGQRLWLDMIGYMHERGFQVWSIQPEFCDPRTGQLLQVNALFSRQPTAATFAA